MKSEIDKEIKAEELKQILEKQKQQLNPLEEVIEETTSSVRDFSREAGKAVRSAEKEHGSQEQSYARFGDPAESAGNQPDDHEKRPG
ncbi:MAG TPA: hypothetical protein ENK50_08435 [Sedimenticola sp.]|nr:hypothetical protein [Sedimenticola sp.]